MIMKSPLQHSRTSTQPTRTPKPIGIRKFSFSLHRPSLAPSHTAEFISPVPHLLTSNSPPSESERKLIRSAIESVSNELANATSKAKHTSKVDPVVQRHHEEGKEFIQAHKAVLSSIRVLPFEILVEIISIYSESFLLDPNPHKIALASRGVVYPWIPSQVSRFWRSAALSLHHLWGQLVVDTCRWPSNKPSKSFLGRFATLVDRSHDAPLCVYFCAPRYTNPDDLRPIIEILASHSERWKTVYLIATSSMLSNFQCIKGRVPNLERLFLSFSGGFPFVTHPPVDLFEVAPQLKTVYLLTSFFSSEVVIPWPQLEVFIDRGDSTNYIKIDKTTFLSQSLTNLQLCGFPIEGLAKPWPEHTLPDLRTLNINLSNNDDDDAHEISTDNFLESLTIPAIKEIKITNYPGNIIPPLTSLIHRSQQCTSLQELCLSTYYLGEFEPGEVASLLELTPFLKRLSIYLPTIPDLSRLIIQPGKPALLPCLEELYIFVYENITGYEEVFSQLTNSRCENPVSASNLNPGNTNICTSLVDANASASERPPPLKHLRLVFPGSVSCHTGQELLEAYNSKAAAAAAASISLGANCTGEVPEDLNEAALSRLAILKNWTVIVHCLPSVFAYFWSPNPKLSTKIKRALQVSQFFSLVESVKVNDVRELHLSDIHHLMHHIKYISSSDIPGDNIYHFRRRAKALLDKWAPLLLNDIKNRRWAYQGAHSIVYVPTDSAIRTSPDVLTEMIYGTWFCPQKYSVSWYDLQVLLQFLD